MTTDVDPPDPARADDSRPSTIMRVVLGLIALGAVVASFLLGVAIAGSDAPADDSAEAGFARDMQTHHAQAVEMSMIIRDRTDDEEIRRLAYDIALTQQQQIGQMAGWLTLWGLPQTGTTPPMTWMQADPGMTGHEMGGQPADPGTMPGMAGPADVQALADADGEEAETRYLELMIAHHGGGVTMAQAILDASDDPVVTRLARTIVTSQQAEIDAMTALLDQRRAP